MSSTTETLEQLRSKALNGHNLPTQLCWDAGVPGLAGRCIRPINESWYASTSTGGRVSLSRKECEVLGLAPGVDNT